MEQDRRNTSERVVLRCFFRALFCSEFPTRCIEHKKVGDGGGGCLRFGEGIRGVWVGFQEKGKCLAYTCTILILNFHFVALPQLKSTQAAKHNVTEYIFEASLGSN